MIDVSCDVCGQSLEEPGALLFSSPIDREKSCVAYKYHLCKACEVLIVDFISNQAKLTRTLSLKKP